MRPRNDFVLVISLLQLLLPSVLWGQERAVDFFNRLFKRALAQEPTFKQAEQHYADFLNEHPEFGK